MRTPSEYIAAAFRKIRDRQMPDCASTMTHGYDTATVTRVGSPKLGEDATSDNSPSDDVRVLALFHDFPSLKKGEAIELDGQLRVVTAATTDPARAHLNVTLSQPFDEEKAAYTGVRREFGRTRNIHVGLPILLLEDGTVDAFSDAIAPTYARAFLVAIRREDWRDATDPEIADRLTISKDGDTIDLKVSQVNSRYGWFVLKCRTKG